MMVVKRFELELFSMVSSHSSNNLATISFYLAMDPPKHSYLRYQLDRMVWKGEREGLACFGASAQHSTAFNIYLEVVLRY